MKDWEQRYYDQERIRLKEKGYIFQIDQYGYRVDYKGEFLHAARTEKPRKMHWQHARKNRQMFLKQAILTAQDHEGGNYAFTE